MDKELPIDPHIFVVDDDRDDHFFIKRALKNIMPLAIVTSVYDGTEAIEYLFNQDNFKNGEKYPDVILLDINMPRMNGKMACKLIRAEKKFDAIPIIILTTSSHPADKEQLLQLGANDYFIKPNDINIFGEILNTIKDKWMVKV